MLNTQEKSLFQKRRDTLAKEIGRGIVILPNAKTKTRSFDTEYKYRSDSYFYYLSGFKEKESLLLLVINQGKCEKSVLFCLPKNPEEEIWEGIRIGPEKAPEIFGIDEAFSIYEAQSYLQKGILDGFPLWYSLGEHNDWDHFFTKYLHQKHQKLRANPNKIQGIYDPRIPIGKMRLLKTDEEIQQIQRACDISCLAHENAMKNARQCHWEYEIESELLYIFKRNNMESAYLPIVAYGENACILHYSENNAPMKPGHLLLVDAACEYNYYASDITRTYPISGQFSKEQRIAYEIVLEAQKQAIQCIQAGQPSHAFHDMALQTLVEGVLSAGILKGSKEEIIHTEKYKLFYMHGTGHWIGLDVHDDGPYPTAKETSPLLPNMCITVEPGLYFRPHPDIDAKFWNIGIRIEDIVCVEKKGNRVLTSILPKAVDDLENLIQGK